jgi:hypothetical protein
MIQRLHFLSLLLAFAGVYATVAFDAAAASLSVATGFATLPEPTASFGAVASDGWLYVYGGHIAPVHSYSTDAVSGRFSRLRLNGDHRWEQLPGGPALQGLNLATYEGKIYRVGGMEPRNAPGQPAAIYSVAECARFDPATAKWEPLPSLPAPRSSHDVVVVGNKLIVVGGWNLKGPVESGEWQDTLAVLDLSAAKPQWKTVPQPFRRRALIAAAYNGKMYVMGGLDDNWKMVRETNIFDPETGVWTKGPDLPGDEMNGFGPAACVHDGDLYVSVADGGLYRLTAEGWQKASSAKPRIAHRMVSDGPMILVLGGADKGACLDSVEAVASK